MYPDITYTFKSIARDYHAYVNQILLSRKSGYSTILDRKVNVTDLRLQVYNHYINNGRMENIFKDIKRLIWWAQYEFKDYIKDEIQWLDLGRLLIHLIKTLEYRGDSESIRKILFIVIKRQISQVMYVSRGSRQSNMDVGIEKALLSLKAGFEYARNVLSKNNEETALLEIEGLVSQARTFALKVLSNKNMLPLIAKNVVDWRNELYPPAITPEVPKKNKR